MSANTGSATACAERNPRAESTAVRTASSIASWERSAFCNRAADFALAASSGCDSSVYDCFGALGAFTTGISAATSCDGEISSAVSLLTIGATDSCASSVDSTKPFSSSATASSPEFVTGASPPTSSTMARSSSIAVSKRCASSGLSPNPPIVVAREKKVSVDSFVFSPRQYAPSKNPQRFTSTSENPNCNRSSMLAANVSGDIFIFPTRDFGYFSKFPPHATICSATFGTYSASGNNRKPTTSHAIRTARASSTANACAMSCGISTIANSSSSTASVRSNNSTARSFGSANFSKIASKTVMTVPSIKNACTVGILMRSLIAIPP